MYSMNKQKNYFEHPGKVVEAGTRFKHVMAITLNPARDNREGIIRCIVSREGDVDVKGYVDRSELHLVAGNSLEKFEIGERLRIKNEAEIIAELEGIDREFIGLEDPDIFVDEKGLVHAYFTMPFINKSGPEKHAHVHVGHAVGKGLDSLVMSEPVLMARKENNFEGAKEVSIAPRNAQGFRYNLVESSRREKDFIYSVVRVAIAEDMGKPWKFGEVAFHPKEHTIPWIGGHASPGPLLPREFIDIGEGKLLGIMNGREANTRVNDKILYGMFSVGLFIYDYEHGKIDWISPEPFIQDSEARTITFASHFVLEGKGKGMLYAHVDDSFVRAYTLTADLIKPHLKSRY